MKDIIQLRNYHLKQGRNNDRTPIYPLTKPEAILGLDAYLAEVRDNGGVIQVDTLPATGEGGKIYYNTTDGKYYTYSDGEYTPFGSSEVAVVTDITDVEVYAMGGSASECTYVIEPNIFYNIEDWDNSSPSGSADGLILYINSVEGPYAGRFTAWKDNMFLGFFVTAGTDVIVPDNIPDIIEGHTYEFNVYQRVCLIVDITSAQEGE